MEPNSPKKIQFSVPLFQSQLDPQASEHIRKRRPTPATLVIYNDPNAADDKQTPSGQGEAPSTQLSPAQRKQSVYTPPTMRELQLVVEQHFQRQEQQQEAGLADSPDTPSPITAQRYGNAASPLWVNHNCPEPNGNDARVSQPLGTQGSPGSSTAAGGIEHQTDAHGACGEEDRDTPHPHPPHPHSIPVSLSRQGLSHLDTLSESEELSAVGAPPRRKDTPYQHQPPFTPGVKQMKTQTQAESPFLEEEEALSDQEEGAAK
ncbi:protein phosphatase 1 regulatory subunit 1C [Clupea harengus]|uniref:Protein phosphatase 1 regulatory subunit 1C n=1 Tax=Clupea harengus TaxID=7950 RepID=A0A6P8GSS1_CLUHA|nr:protein phosphatase 1 regulatory subunit 1C [Clupea harengus]